MPKLPLPQKTRYDALSRYLTLQAGPTFFPWAVGLPSACLGFSRWLPATLTWPGAPERFCDAVAELLDHERGGLPIAALLEIQTVPDATMPGRLMVAGGLVWLLLKPAPLPGDRYDLVAVVVNLTGVGNAARVCQLGDAVWTLRPVEINLETLDASAVLDQVEAGEAPREVLAWLSLMQRGDDRGIIQRWRAVVDAEMDLRRRADYALVQVFAERVGRGPLWQTAVEGLSMIESPMIAKLLSDARAEAAAAAAAAAAAKARAETSANDLLRVLRKRHKALPDELTSAIRGCTDVEQLDRLFELALDTKTLAQFRRKAGL